jgi:GNAT superfamily N-acetyltransferase
MTHRLRITSAQTADLERYIDLLEDIQDWLRMRNLTPLPPAIHRDSADYYGESIRRGEVYFAYLDDKAVGSLRLVSEDSIVWPDANDNALYLYNLVVLRDWSGQNIGQQMLAWAEKQARLASKPYLRLDCFAFNLALRTYYERAGYADRGEIEASYPFGVLRLQRYEKRLNK